VQTTLAAVQHERCPPDCDKSTDVYHAAALSILSVRPPVCF